MAHVFSSIPEIPGDALFALRNRYLADSNPKKVDLGIGAYRDENGKPWILPSVRKADKLIHDDPEFNHEYLPMSGFAPFIAATARVILGENSKAVKEKRVASVQSLSGTGSLHLGAKFLNSFYKSSDTVYISQPTWANHYAVFQSQGLKTAAYAYWDDNTKSLDLENYLKDLEAAPEGSIILLHACAHNPTGLDPTREEWIRIIKILQKKNHLPFFDCAYQGFASGNLNNDAWAIQQAVESLSSPILVSQSFAKNFGLYGERVGALHIVLPSSKGKEAISSQLQALIRSEVSNAPAYGAKIVARVLTTPELRKQWEEDLVTMSQRIFKQREALRQHLIDLGTPGNWDHIVKQQGMFSFTGLSGEYAKRLESEHSVYLAANGRISVAGLNDHNVRYVAEAFDQVVRNVSK